MFAAGVLVLGAFAAADEDNTILERLAKRKALQDDEADDPQPVGGSGDVAMPRPWMKVEKFDMIEDGAIVMLYNNYLDNSRLTINNNNCYSSYEATGANQLWKLKLSKFGGVGVDLAYYVESYSEPASRLSTDGGGAYCWNGQLHQENAWDFQADMTNPGSFKLINSEHQGTRLTNNQYGQLRVNNGDADAKDYFTAKSPFGATPKWVVADMAENKGAAAASQSMTMMTGMTSSIAESIAMMSSSIPNPFQKSMDMTFQTVTAKTALSSDDQMTVQKNAKMAFMQAGSFMYTMPTKMAADVPAGAKMCLYQLQFDMMDAVMGKPWKYMSHINRVMACKGSDTKGTVVMDNAQAASLYTAA